MPTKPKLQDLTVFIISSGEDTTAECESALKKQDCTFKIQHIRDTFPMSRAFQRMPDECQTPYFVQVDGDMILKPHAIRTLYEGARSSSFWHYVAYGQLFEEGFGVGGAVRCWKKSLFRLFQFRDCRTVDRDLYKRLRWLGLRSKNLNQVLGLHQARHSEYSQYLKTKSDVEKWRFLGRAPDAYALGVLQQALRSLPGTRFELLGACLGALTPDPRLSKSKDMGVEAQRFTTLKTLIGLEAHIAPESWNTLITLFTAAYRDRGETLTTARKSLTDLVLKLFPGNPSTTREQLWKVVSQ